MHQQFMSWASYQINEKENIGLRMAIECIGLKDWFDIIKLLIEETSVSSKFILEKE